MATSTTTPKGKYTESLTFSTPNCIYANYGKLGKPSLQSDGVTNWKHSHNPHLDDGCVNFWKDFLKNFLFRFWQDFSSFQKFFQNLKGFYARFLQIWPRNFTIWKVLVVSTGDRHRGPIGQNENSCKTSNFFWKTQKKFFKTSKSF